MKEFLLTFSAVMIGLGISKLIKAVVFKIYYLKKEMRKDKRNEKPML